MIIRDLPLIWRLNDQDQAPLPRGVPARMDFEWDWDDRLGLLRQKVTPALLQALAAIYAAGSENLGATPGYGMDFWRGLSAEIRRIFHDRKKIRALEIGPGDGWLIKKLRGLGVKAEGCSDFPSAAPVGRFDLIVHHHVLEHIADPLGFIMAQKDILNPGGAIICLVPNCSLSIRLGDQSMACHQHINYFSSRSLAALGSAAGLVQRRLCLYDEKPIDGFDGHLMFAFTRPGGRDDIRNVDWSDDFDDDFGGETFGRFYSRAVLKRNQVATIFACRENYGTYGIYAPMRILPYSRLGGFARLFDDGMRGKYLDGIYHRIEGIEDFEAKPVDVMFVMSMTHERQIVEKLAGRCKVITLREMLDA